MHVWPMGFLCIPTGMSLIAARYYNGTKTPRFQTLFIGILAAGTFVSLPLISGWFHSSHYSFTNLNMKVAVSFLTVLVSLTASVAGHASGRRPDFMARHARVARELEAVPPVSEGHVNVNTHVHRTCKPKPTVSSTSLLLSLVARMCHNFLRNEC